MADIGQHRLGVIRALLARIEYINASIGHSLTQGEANELALRDLLVSLLPGRYGVGSGVVVGTDGSASRQIDVVVYDKGRANFALAADPSLFLVDQVIAAIEVKTRFTSGEKSTLSTAVENIASVKSLPMATHSWIEKQTDPSTGATEARELYPMAPIGIVLFFLARENVGALDLDNHLRVVSAAVNSVPLHHRPDLLLSLGHAAVLRYPDLARRAEVPEQSVFLVQTADAIRGLAIEVESDVKGLVTLGDSSLEELTTNQAAIISGRSSRILVTGGGELSLDPQIYPVARIAGKQYLLDRGPGVPKFPRYA